VPLSDLVNGHVIFNLVGPESVTRTLSARYNKDGSEILVSQGEGINQVG